MFSQHFLDAFDLTDLSDVSFTTLICGGLLLVATLLVLQLATVCWYYSETTFFSEFIKEFRKNERLLVILFLAIAFNLCFLQMKLETDFSFEDCFKYSLRILFLSSFSVIILVLIPDDDVELARSQDYKCSIGACWANGAIFAYYNKSLEEFRERVNKFEEKYPHVKLVKKLVLIAPLSCNIEGRISDKDASIQYFGDLETIECDEGANMNRRLRNPVYKINKDEDVYVASEFPSPLGTLWGERYGMDTDVKVYIRDCFLKELKEQLKHQPVIILEYDDQNPSEIVPLHQYIISSLQKGGLLNVSSCEVNKIQNGNASNFVINKTKINYDS